MIMHETDKNLYIPQGLKVDKEIFDGFGKKEMIRSLAIFCILIMADGLIYLFKRNVMTFIVIMLISASASIMIIQKDRSNISVYDQVKYMLRFHKSQKYYKYKCLPEWGGKIEK